VKYGADVIKICASGGVAQQRRSTGTPQYTLEEMQAIAEEAPQTRRKVARTRTARNPSRMPSAPASTRRTFQSD